MSIKSLIDRCEGEREEIKKKIADLQERDQFLVLFLKEVKAASRDTGRKAGDKAGGKTGGKAGGKAGRKAAEKKVKTAERKAAKAGGKSRKKGTMTVREGIVKTVAAAGKPLTAGEIIAGAADLSGGAVPSIRTQINALAKIGELEQVPYSGRGFQYQIPKTSPKAPAKKEKAEE